jgi:endonuclease/exonuclease/phosphatase family metal-dependent hydrolase
MKLISLNIWAGHCYENLMNFIQLNKDVDIFCFQEVYSEVHQKIEPKEPGARRNIFECIEDILPDHYGIFCPIMDYTYGMATFVRKGISILKQGSRWIYQNPEIVVDDPSHSRCLQYNILRFADKKIGIFNIHGLWNGRGKGDSPERIAQTECILNFAKTFDCPVLLCGDFNLMLDTESVAIIETEYQNLIRKYNINSTRSNLYTKPERYADYIFIPKGINVSDFQVYNLEVSDHLPLVVSMEI